MPVPFEEAGQFGLLATEDPAMISELEKAAKNHIGGVVKLTEQQYRDWTEKKKASLLSPSSPSGDRESIGPIPHQQLAAIRAAGAAAIGSNLISSPNQAQQQARQQAVPALEVPTEIRKPRVGRMPGKTSESPPSQPVS